MSQLVMLFPLGTSKLVETVTVNHNVFRQKKKGPLMRHVKEAANYTYLLCSNYGDLCKNQIIPKFTDECCNNFSYSSNSQLRQIYLIRYDVRQIITGN